MMDLELITSIPATALMLALLITLLAGVVKGAIGFAMPLIMVSGISSVLDPKLAIAAIIIPIVVSNGLQAFREGLDLIWHALREYGRYVLIVCVMIFLAAQWVPSIPSSLFYIVLDVPVVILSLMQLAGVRFHIPPRHRAWADWLIGTLSGALGGLAGTWGPTTVLYLLAVDTPKRLQMVVQGVVYGLGSVTLLFAHLKSGILNAQTLPLSFAMLPAALVGMWLGFKVQDRLDQARFRRITLIVLTVAGLNLLRKGLLT